MRYAVYVLILLLGLMACANSSRKNADYSPTEYGPIESPSLSVDDDSPERGKGFPDFRNFRYPHSCFDMNSSSFRLKGGEYVSTDIKLLFHKAAYVDVTADSIPEAIVVLSEFSGGTAMHNCVYIFSKPAAKLGEPRLLWAFQTGDRVDSGLRSVFGDEGKLVIDTYTPTESLGDCCPKYFMRKIYSWNGHSFTKESEVRFVNPIRGTEIIVGKN